MPWIKIDDQMAFHRKVLTAGNEAVGAWVRAMSWSAKEGTDGIIPKETAFALAPKRIWDRLCTATLVHKVDPGYEIHDYLDYNLSAEEIASKRRQVNEARAEAGRKGAAARWQKDGNRHGKPDGKPIAPATKPDGQTMAKTMATECPQIPDPRSQIPEKIPPTPVAEPPSTRPMPASEARSWGAFWLETYERLVSDALGKPVSWDPHKARSTLDRLVTKLCPPEHRREPTAWLAELVPEFVDAARAKPSVYSAFAPAGFERWLNEREPDEIDEPTPADPPAADRATNPSRVPMTPEQRARRMAQLAEIENDPTYQEKFL